jgi:hypothetical protein
MWGTGGRVAPCCGLKGCHPSPASAQTSTRLTRFWGLDHTVGYIFYSHAKEEGELLQGKENSINKSWACQQGSGPQCNGLSQLLPALVLMFIFNSLCKLDLFIQKVDFTYY